MMGLDERSWLCSGPEIWPEHFFYQLKSESEGVDPLGGRAYIFILIMGSSRTSGPTSDVPTLTSGPRRAQPRSLFVQPYIDVSEFDSTNSNQFEKNSKA